MNSLKELEGHLPTIEERLTYTFEDKNFLVLALTHRSFINENRAVITEHNERLEFLGDSILGLIVADYLYHRLPSYPEGQLSQLRSKIVDAASCALYLQKLHLADFILLGKGERLGVGKTKVSILADVFEAIIGAIYLDGGLAITKAFFLSQFDQDIDQVIGSPPRNYKAELQDYSQKKYQEPPTYKVIQETGPEHGKTFHVLVTVGGEEMGIGIGPSKKEAEQRAAFEALSKLGL